MTKIFKIFIIVVAFVLPFSAIAQENGNRALTDFNQPEIDSILYNIHPNTPDSLKAKFYFDAALITNNINERLKYAKLSLEHCNENDTFLIVENSPVIAYCYYANGYYDTLLNFLHQAIELAQKTTYLRDLQKLYRLKSMYYDFVNNEDSMFHYFNKALEICIQTKDTSQMAACYQEFGVKYANRKFYAEAEKNYIKAMELDSIINDHLEYAIVCHRRGELYTLKPDTNFITAKNFLIKSVNIFDSIYSNNIRYVISKYLAYNSLADVYIKLAEKNSNKKYADSCYYYNSKSLEYFLNSGYTDYYCYLSTTHVEYLKFHKKYQEAINFLLGLGTFINPNNYDLLNTYYFQLRQIYKKIGDYKKAYEYFEKNYETSIALTNDSTMNKIADAKAMQAVMIEKMNHETDEKLHAAETARLKVVRSRMIVIIIALLVGLALIFKTFLVKKKANAELSKINHLLNIQKDEIKKQRDEISKQNDVITEQWREVESINYKLLSSINYAQRIQTAAVSKESEVKEIFPESFVFYRPRDIVSGDYYRCGRFGKYSVMITADCTGHGIPGAFLSMLGLSALKEYMVTEYDAENPGTVLDRMRTFIKSTLTSSQQSKAIEDGMDMTICSFNFEDMELHYAIANQKLMYLRDGIIYKLKGDNMPVGHYIREKEHFQTFTMKIQKDDIFYLFTDGIEDQLGGDTTNGIGKKFLISNLQDFLLEISSLPLNNQEQLLSDKIDDWRGDIPPIDDMTMVAIKI
jgi:serine phosphatase RsbU (regulator of sigma subunit)